MTDVAVTRTEKDSMGEFDVPSDAYYGATTMRVGEETNRPANRTPPRTGI